MTTFVDSSALLKLYVAEPDSPTALALLESDPVLVTSWLSHVEVRRNLARVLNGTQLIKARQQCDLDFDLMALITLDEPRWRSAADIAEELGVRTLDAIHLACAQKLNINPLTFVTFDVRQAQAARRMGFTVVGA